MSDYLHYYLDMKKKQNRGDKFPSLQEVKSDYLRYLLELTGNDLERTAKILDVPRASLNKNIKE